VKGEGWLTHGFAGELAQAIGPELEGSVEPMVCCLLSCFGSAVGPGPWVSAGADRHRANVFACLVAPSGVGKSEPWAVCSALMQYADAEWHRNAVTGLGSGEGLVERLEAQPTAFAVEAEFGSVLTKARRDGSTLAPTLCNAWDGKAIEIANRGKAKLRAAGHHVSVWANITDAELHKRLNGSLEAVNGFGNRFLWLRQGRVRLLPFGGDMRCLEQLGGELRGVIARAKAIGRVRWGDDAKPIWEAAYAGLCSAQEAMPCLGRARSHALRLTLLYALLDGSDTIRAEHVRCGLSAWAWAEASARAIFGESDGPGTGTAQATAPAAPALAFVWGGGAADTPAHAEATAEQQHTTAEPTGGVSPAKAVGVKAKALARIHAQPGILRGDLLRRAKAKAAALDAALAELEAKGAAFPRPSPGGKGEGWWPGVKPEPSPDKWGEKSSHPSPFTGGEAFTPAEPSPVKGEGSGEGTAHQQESGSVHPSPFTGQPSPVNTGVRGEGSGEGTAHQPSQPASTGNASVWGCCPVEGSAYSAEDLAFLPELEQTDANAPGWDASEWLAAFREGRA
jgi:hypothetical protein